MPRRKRSVRLLRAALISAATIATSGCANWKEITGTPKQVCNTWKPIYPSRKDVLTDGTQRQIVGNNAAQETWCGQPEAQSKMARVAP